VSWSSRKQATVSHFSTETEYRSLAMATSEFLWLTSLLKELDHQVSRLSVIWCDNLGATFLVANPIYHAHTKHIKVDFHFVREKLANKQLVVHFLCSNDQIADGLTKSLAKNRFQQLRNKLTVSQNRCA
jgi:hypothetical protein